MGITINNYNKIIDLTFYGTDGTTEVYKIKCPRKGIKPNIQITGSMLPNKQIFNLQIKIRNLYMDLNQSSFTRVKVTAGYENKPVTFTGDIWYMYRENPGPESVTSIMIQQAYIKDFMSGTVNVSYSKGDSIYAFLVAVGKAAGYTNPPSLPLWATNLTFPDRFSFNGMVSEAVNKFTGLFPDLHLAIKFEDNGLTLYSTSKDYSSTALKTINFLSTPPQLISDGDDSGTVATLTAPWDPSIRPGDTVVCPTTFYINTMPGLSSLSGSKTISINVTSLQFQFSTMGSMNSMVIQGVS